MAEPTAQNPQDTSGGETKVPKWLAKAKDLAAHEEKGATPEPVEATKAAEESEEAAVLPETTPLDEAEFEAAEPETKPEEVVKKAPVAVEKPAEPAAPKEEGGVKIPAWLKKASEKAAGLVKPAEPAAAPEPVKPAAELEPVKTEAAAKPEPAKTEAAAAPEPAAAPPAPAPEPLKPAEPTAAVKTPTTKPPQPPAPPQAAIQKKPTGEKAPVGLLETKKEEIMPESLKETEAPPKAEPAKEAPAPAAAPPAAKAPSKKAAFDTAKDILVESMQKMNKAVDVGTTAGVAVAKEKKTKEAAVEAVAAKGTAKEKAVSAEEKKKVVEAEKIYQEGLATVRDLIAPSSMDVKYDDIRVEGMYAQTFYVYAYPRFLDANWLSPIINFDVTMDIAQFVYPIESEAIMRTLKKKVAQMQSSIRIAQEKGMVSDPAVETALQDAEELRTAIQRGQEKFFQFGLYFTIYSESEKKLKKIAKQLESILGGKLILTKKAELQMEHGFNSCIPLCLDELEVSRNMNTSPLSSTFPFSSADLTSNEGILYGLNRHNDSLIIFDRFSLENANSVVFAKSGAGKSYAIKLEILRSMMIGTDVIVIDPENEYEALAQTVGGSYLKVSLTADRRINPFDLPAPLEGEDVQPGDLLRQNIITLNGLLKLMLGDMTPQEESIIDKALIDVYALKGITMEVVDPSEFPPPTMEDLYDILSTSEGGMNLAQRLQKYTSGTYAGIFNKPTNVDLESGLMVFSIRDLEDALRPTAMYIILHYIWNRIRSKLKRRILVIDEAWSLMQHDDSAKFLFGLVKRARKYYLGITTITQDVEDFVKSPYGKPVVTNSSMQILLKQAPAAISMLGKIFDLTEGEKYMLLNSGVGQGLFFAGMKHVAIQIIASYTEDKIVTTNPEEILKAKQSEEEFETA
jgi:conjugal transfer ATP-binding protein TraC